MTTRRGQVKVRVKELGYLCLEPKVNSVVVESNTCMEAVPTKRVRAELWGL